MSTPQPNAPTTPARSTPPVIPVPTTPPGAVQKMLSMLSPPAGSQGTLPPHPTHMSPVEMLSDLVPVLSPALPAHAPPAHTRAHASATQIPVGITMPAATSISSHGRNTPPRVPASVTRSYSALPEFSLPLSRPILVPGGDIPRRATAHDEYSETVGLNKDDEEDKSRFTDPKMVGARLHPTVVEAKKECKKAEATVKQTVLLVTIAIGLQVLLGALTTAVGAALSGKNTSIAISVLGGAATVVASFLARTHKSKEPETSRSRAQALNHFLREIRGFQLDYGVEIGHQWDDTIRSYRLGLEQILGSRPGSVAVHPGKLGPIPRCAGDPVDTTIPAQGGNDGSGAEVYPSTMANNLANKFGYNTV